MRIHVALLTSSFLFLGALLIAGCVEETTPTPIPVDPARLDPPALGTGFQFQTEDITVGAGVEEQDCYFFKVSDLAQQGGLDPSKPVNLHQVQVAQRLAIRSIPQVDNKLAGVRSARKATRRGIPLEPP